MVILAKHTIFAKTFHTSPSGTKLCNRYNVDVSLSMCDST